MSNVSAPHAATRDLLAPVYEWFTEGFETRDLKDAKVLLKEPGRMSHVGEREGMAAVPAS